MLIEINATTWLGQSENLPHLGNFPPDCMMTRFVKAKSAGYEEKSIKNNLVYASL